MPIRISILLSLLIVTAITGCRNPVSKVAIAEKVTVEIPAKLDNISTDSTGYPFSWETSFEDDHLALYRFEILVADSTFTGGSLAELQNNVNEFLSTFEVQNLDSLYTVEVNYLKADISFEYFSDDEKYKFFGRFLVKDTSFIALCYITPLPVDRFSKKRKDKIFESVTVQ